MTTANRDPLDVIAARAAIVLVCWWLLPILCAKDWCLGVARGHTRLTLREEMRIAIDVMREEWNRDDR